MSKCDTNYHLGTFDEYCEETISSFSSYPCETMEGPQESIGVNAVQSGAIESAGLQTKSLQEVFDAFPSEMNLAGIAKSTGKPKMTPPEQQKGFAAEEYLKWRMKVEALANGIPNHAIGVSTSGIQPDGTVLSPIDPKVDILVWTRKHLIGKPVIAAQAQLKMHKNPKKYAEDFSKEKYADPNLQKIGARDNSSSSVLKAKIRGKEISASNLTNNEAIDAALHQRMQDTPEYPGQKEAFRHLDRINMRNTVVGGVASGLIFSSVEEICYLLKNKDDLDEQQYVASIKHILTGAIDGGIRSGASLGAMQLVKRVVKKEIPANAPSMIPLAAIADVTVDFAKDLYECCFTKRIDTDDLLCSTVEKSFSSVAHYGGSFAGKHLGSHIVSRFASAKASAEIGAALGSPLGPLGSVVGAMVGSVIIGECAKYITKAAKAEAEEAFTACIDAINEHIEEKEGCERLFYFADSLEGLSDFRLSFKCLIPCHNIIADLNEYNLRKKALNSRRLELQKALSQLDSKSAKIEEEIIANQNEELNRIKQNLLDFKQDALETFRNCANSYIEDSYYQFVSSYEIRSSGMSEMINELQTQSGNRNVILECMKNRMKADVELNSLLADLLDNEEDASILKPIVYKLQRIMGKGDILYGKQYISVDEALLLVSEVV